MDYEELSAGRDQVCRVPARWTSTPHGLGRSLHYLFDNIVTVSKEYVCVCLCVFSERTQNEVMYCFELYLGKSHDSPPVVKQFITLDFSYILFMN